MSTNVRQCQPMSANIPMSTIVATSHETPVSEAQSTRINHIREIQQRNQEQREQRRRENNKFEVILTA
jgi:hypothetical protein